MTFFMLMAVEIGNVLAAPTISGYARTSGGTRINGVTVTFSNSGGTATTDSTGYYRRTVSSGWSGSATPSLSGYTFSPTSLTYTNITTSQFSQNYTGRPPPNPTISGYVRTSGSTGINGVTVTFSNSGGTATTDSTGYYRRTVSSGWSGSATPSLSGYTFSPTSLI